MHFDEYFSKVETTDSIFLGDNDHVYGVTNEILEPMSPGYGKQCFTSVMQHAIKSSRPINVKV